MTSIYILLRPLLKRTLILCLGEVSRSRIEVWVQPGPNVHPKPQALGTYTGKPRDPAWNMFIFAVVPVERHLRTPALEGEA